jgi:hypothetical protein
LAFEHVFRAFRGMPEDRVYFKDTSYLVGKMNILQFLASTEASASTVLDFMDQGKFDPNNPLHIEILKNLGFDYFV